jgi:hypothetical protein
VGTIRALFMMRTGHDENARGGGDDDAAAADDDDDDDADAAADDDGRQVVVNDVLEEAYSDLKEELLKYYPHLAPKAT